jgi:protein phosphatase 1L
MWIGNVGDSRAVVCERGAANQLTVDHEPHTTNERQRIEKHGGFVTTFPGTIFVVLSFLLLNAVVLSFHH